MPIPNLDLSPSSCIITSYNLGYQRPLTAIRTQRPVNSRMCLVNVVFARHTHYYLTAERAIGCLAYMDTWTGTRTGAACHMPYWQAENRRSKQYQAEYGRDPCRNERNPKTKSYVHIQVDLIIGSGAVLKHFQLPSQLLPSSKSPPRRRPG